MSNNDNSLSDKVKYDLSFKMIVVGDVNVGKSCLTGRAIKGIFSSEYEPTIGFEFLSYYTKIDNEIIKLQIWDTAGQEIYRSLITNFYRNSSLAMMVYAIDSRQSFLNLNIWLNEIKINSNPDVKIILIGNKVDLENERKVSLEEARKYKEENHILYFEETSAKTGINVQEVFNEAARILYNEYKKYKTRGNNFRGNKEEDKTHTKLTKVETNRNKGCC